MKRYKFEVIITEGCDEFWDEIKGESGCDAVEADLKTALNHHLGPDATTVKLIEFTNR